MRLKEKVAIVTGAASGIGKATSILFASQGAKVVLADVDVGRGEEVQKLIEEQGGQAMFIQTDVSKSAQVQELIQAAVRRFGKLDILYNNAGIPQQGPIESIAEEEWDRVYSVNVKGVFFGAKYAVPVMKQAGGGVIINTASISGVRPRPGNAAYSSAKGAVIVLTKALAIELAPFKIRVNCINPVAADTPMLPKFWPDKSKENLDRALASIPLGRLCHPEDVAFAALYLASDEASLLTGVTLNVDGGRSI